MPTSAQRFAKALDAEDYELARCLLHADCRYTCRGETYIGPDEIVDSYRKNGTLAKKFDAIEYDSNVIAESDTEFRIEFVDHIRHQGNSLTFHCEQRVVVDPSGLIVEIWHVDLDGQVEALNKFKSLCFG